MLTLDVQVETGLRFAQKLQRAWDAAGSLLCVGLDPILERFPPGIAAEPRPVLAFNRMVIDAVGDLVCAFKPQFAHYGAVGAEADLADTIAYIRRTRPHAVIILDAKRGDIGSTAQMYAREAFERYDADAVTVNPFMGEDTLEPYLDRPDRGALVLCRTSNPGASWIQEMDCGGEPLFAAIARRAQTRWNRLENVMLVVGATAPAELAQARTVAPDLAILVPGVGEQGGSPRRVVAAGAWPDGRGLVVSASRSVIFAGDADRMRAAARELHDELAAPARQVDVAATGRPETTHVRAGSL
jgi:orotidine-5'-phosphate decarboxylase